MQLKTDKSQKTNLESSISYADQPLNIKLLRKTQRFFYTYRTANKGLNQFSICNKIDVKQFNQSRNVFTQQKLYRKKKQLNQVLFCSVHNTQDSVSYQQNSIQSEQPRRRDDTATSSANQSMYLSLTADPNQISNQRNRKLFQIFQEDKYLLGRQPKLDQLDTIKTGQDFQIIPSARNKIILESQNKYQFKTNLNELFMKRQKNSQNQSYSIRNSPKNEAVQTHVAQDIKAQFRQKIGSRYNFSNIKKQDYESNGESDTSTYTFQNELKIKAMLKNILIKKQEVINVQSKKMEKLMKISVTLGSRGHSQQGKRTPIRSIKKDLLISRNLPKPDFSDSDSISSDVEKKNFIYQLLSLAENKPKKRDNDEELKMKTDNYWRFDKKGRNIQELEELKLNRRLRKYASFNQSLVKNILRMKYALITCVRKMKMMRINADELLSGKVIYKKPFQREGSYVFFKAIEKQNVALLQLCIERCRYHLFDLDYQKQTGLHIACTKGYTDIARYLIDQGSYLDATDLAQRTPLWYALRHNHVEIVLDLLYNKANPWSSKYCDYQKAAQTDEMQRALKISRRLHILILISPSKDRNKLWDKYRKHIYK